MRAWLLIPVISLLFFTGCNTSRYGVADQLLEDGQYNAAVREYLKELNPHIRNGKRYIYFDKEAMTGVALVYYRMERYRTAEKIFNTVLKKDPTYGKARFYLGLTMESMAREDEAISVYKGYTKTQPYDPYRQVMLGRLDYMTRSKISREMRLAIQNEQQLKPSLFPVNSIAVLYFASLADKPEWRPIQKGLAEMLINDLSQVDQLQVVERMRVNALMDEMRLSVADMADEANAERIGKLLGARTLVNGAYLIFDNLNMNLSANIIHLDNVLIPNEKVYEGKISQLFQMEKRLVLEILDNFKIELTPSQRDEILRVPTQNMDAFIHYCDGLDALDQYNFGEAQRHFRLAIGEDDTFIYAMDYLVPFEIWEVTHAHNINRVQQEVERWMEEIPAQISPDLFKPPPALVSAKSRLQWMGVYQDADFLPGTESRRSIQEADINGAVIVPKRLAAPPMPPQGF